jgi:hypothetical protein
MILKIVLAGLSMVLALLSVVSAVVIPVCAALEMRSRALRHEGGGVSLTPVVGTIAGFLAILLAPVGTIRERVVWFWVPLASEVAVLLVVYAALVISLKISARRQQATHDHEAR